MKKTFTKTHLIQDYVKLYKHYQSKHDNPALLYQVGSFYNLFGYQNVGNLENICKDVGLRVTQINKKITHSPHQAGFPADKVDHWIKIFLDKGYTVIIYSQRLNSKNKVERYLEKICSKGTNIDDVSDPDSLNIASVYIEKGSDSQSPIDVSIAVLDLSIGSSMVYSVIDSYKNAMKVSSRIINSLQPKEIVLAQCDKQMETDLAIDCKIVHRIPIVNKSYSKISYQDEFFKMVYSDIYQNKNSILNPIEYMNLERDPSLVISLIIILNFAYEHDEKIIRMIQKPTIIRHKAEMYVSKMTMEMLNITKGGISPHTKNTSLFKVLDFTKTPLGRRGLMKRITSPVMSVKVMRKRYDDIEKCIDNKVEISDELSCIGDIEKYHRKICLGRIHPSEFSQLDSSYVAIWNIIRKFKIIQPDTKTIRVFRQYISHYRNVLNLKTCAKFNIDNADVPLFVSGMYPDLDELYHKYTLAWSNIKSYAIHLSNIICDGDDDLVKIKFTKTDGYYFVTTYARYLTLIKVKPEFQTDKAKKGSTIKLCDSKIRELSDLLCNGKRQIMIINKNRFLEFQKELMIKFGVLMRVICKYVTDVDVLQSISTASSRYKYCKPIIDDSVTLNETSSEETSSEEGVSTRGSARSFIRADSLRHPIVELMDNNTDYVPNDVTLVDNGILIYGVNGSGKSLYLKSIALSIFMAQTGLYVPATSYTFYPFKNMITKLCKRDDIHHGKSEYICELDDMRDMFDKMGQNTIVLADELCSSTLTIDAISIVTSAIDCLVKNKTLFAFTTHFHQLKDTPIIKDLKKEKRISSVHLETIIRDKDITYGRTLREGEGPDDYGIEIAKALKIGNDEFIAKAYSTRRFIKGEPNQLLPDKFSRYNSNVVMKQCRICGTKNNLITHHIQHQADADENGMIDGKHKNRKSNLDVLCQSCHQTEHSKD